MQINNHLLVGEGIKIDLTKKNTTKFGENLPDTIVIHYTAGSSFQSSVNTLKNPFWPASAHVVVGKDGELAQLVSFDTQAWHAGKSVRGMAAADSINIPSEFKFWEIK